MAVSNSRSSEANEDIQRAVNPKRPTSAMSVDNHGTWSLKCAVFGERVSRGNVTRDNIALPAFLVQEARSCNVHLVRWQAVRQVWEVKTAGSQVASLQLDAQRLILREVREESVAQKDEGRLSDEGIENEEGFGRVRQEEKIQLRHCRVDGARQTIWCRGKSA